MKTKINAVLVAAVAFSLAAADATYEWTGGDATLGGGAVTIVCAAGTGAVTSMAVNPPDGGTVTLTGTPMTFADGATLTLTATGSVSFAGKVTALGVLTLARGDDVYKVWKGSALTEPEGASMPLVFPGLTTADIDLVRVIATPGSIAGGGRYEFVSGPDVNKFYTLNHVGATAVYSLRVQLQDKADGIHARCRTGVRSPRFGLYPGEEDAWATTGLWEYFIKPARKTMPWGLYGYETDPATYGGTWVARIASFGLTKIVARRKGAGEDKAFVRFAGGAAFGGALTIDAGVEAVLAVSEGDGAATLANDIMGDGDLTIVPQPTTTAFAGSTYREDFISSTNWIVIATNRSLSTLTAIEGYMQGENHNATGNPSLCGTYGYSYNAATDTATVQFQFNRNPGVKVVNATLRQNGPNIEIHGDSAGYDESASDRYMKDWITNTGTKVSERKDLSLGFVNNNYTTGYGIRKVTATFGGTTTRGYATVSGSLKGLSGGRLKVEGGEVPAWLTVSSIDGLPAGGEARVTGANSEIRLYVTSLNSDAGISGGTSRLVAEEGGIIHSAKDWQIRSIQDVEIHNGLLKVDNTAQYINYLTLSNATVTNQPPRAVLGQTTQNWRIRGTGPSFVRSGVLVYGLESYAAALAGNRTFHIDVADVTGDEGVDCTLAKIQGSVDRPAATQENYAWFMFEKQGAGTLKLTGDGKGVRMPATIGNGTFLFGAGSAMTNDFVLAGGSLAAEAGSANTLGALTVNTNATLTVEAGGQLSFASFAAGSGLAAKAVAVSAPLTGNALRFRTGLSAAQLAFFRWRDGAKLWHVRQDEEGYLHPLMLGTVFSVR